MFFAAIAHAFAFPPRDYMDPNGQQPRGILRNLRIMFDVRDVVDDVQGAVDHGVCPTFLVWITLYDLSALYLPLDGVFLLASCVDILCGYRWQPSIYDM